MFDWEVFVWIKIIEKKYKDNPYTIYIEDNKYYIKFNNKTLEIEKEIYDVFDLSERHDRKELNEVSNHIEHLDLSDESIYFRSKYKEELIEERFIEESTYEELMKAINKLKPIQIERVKKYYFLNMTQQEIADSEGVDIRTIQYSLEKSLKKLKNLLEKIS